MTLQVLIGYVINASIVLLVFALGLETTAGDLLYLWRRPGLLIRSIVSMNVVMVVFATVAALVLDLARPIEIALVALAMSPVPPILPKKQVKAGGTSSYAIGLLVAASLAAIVLVPLETQLEGIVFAGDYHIGAERVLAVVLGSVILPLGLGILVQRFLPDLGDRFARPISLLATVLLVLACLPVLVASWDAVWVLVGDGVVIALVLFALVGIAVGHLLGGPDADDRTVLALATSTRHPGVAVAIASANFPDEKAVMAVVIYHLVFGAIVALPYVRWRKHVHAAGPAGGEA